MKKQILAFGTLASIVTPIVTVVSCGSNKTLDYVRGEGDDLSLVEKGFAENSAKHQNVMSSYFNATDMLVSLGYLPDYASVTSLNKVYPDFLKPFLGDNNVGAPGTTVNTGKYQIGASGRVMDGQAVDTEMMARNKISTLLLNEWEKVDESKFMTFMPAILYTSMSDGKSRVTDEDYVQKGGFGFGFDFSKAFAMLAKGLDRAYPGHNFLQHANDLSTKIRANITKLHDGVQNDNNFKGKSLLILDPTSGTDVTQPKIPARSAGLYNVFYSKHPDRGLGFEFPKPHHPANVKYSSFDVSAINNVTFQDEFANTADYVLILDNHKIKKEELDVVKNVAKHLLKSEADLDRHLRVVDRERYYDTVWGVYGTNQILDYFAHDFGITYQANPIEEFSATRELKKLR